jgi:hypothetical protein
MTTRRPCSKCQAAFAAMGLVAFACTCSESEAVSTAAAYIPVIAPEPFHGPEFDTQEPIIKPQVRAITTEGPMPFNNSAALMQPIYRAWDTVDAQPHGMPLVLRASADLWESGIGGSTHR